MIPVFLVKVWSFVRNYWYVPVALVTACYFVFRRDRSPAWHLADALDDARNSHIKELKVIDEAHAQEVARREKSLERMEYVKKQIEEEYRLAERDLDARTMRRVKSIVKKLEDDPDAMAEEIRKETGFTVIVL